MICLIQGLGLIALVWLIFGLLQWYILYSDQVIRNKNDLWWIFSEGMVCVSWGFPIWINGFIKEIRKNIAKKREVM